LPELALVVSLFLIYKLGRLAADGHVGRAYANAIDIWHVERAIHVPNEAAIQHVMLHSITLTHTVNIYYAVVHFPATIAFLVWIYARRPGLYIPLRRLMALVTAIALAVHMAFPLAPPRMLPERLGGVGLIDTGAVYGPSVYGPPSTDTLSNQYAAMPSLHVGWALIVAIGMILALRSRWRWLWALYPLTTFLVVVATANHYWADGVIAITIVAAVAPVRGVLGRQAGCGGGTGRDDELLRRRERRSPIATTASAAAIRPASAANGSTSRLSRSGVVNGTPVD
jgi:hypothetical protein